MPKFSNDSTRILNTCHPELIALFQNVVQTYDCTIVSGHRNATEQAELFRTGRSHTLRSQHLLTPSYAVDVVPYPVDWYNIKRFYHFAGYVQRTALDMGISIVWGGDWDNDKIFDDQKFNDLAHYSR